MYEDFYPYIPGSLEARQRIKKRRLKRLCYGFGAFIVFSSGFITGLAWQAPDMATTQPARQPHRQIAAVHTPLAEPLAPPAEPISLPKLAAPDADMDMDTAQATTKTEALSLPSAILGSARQPDRALTEVHTEAASRPEPPKPPVIEPDAPKPQKPAPPLRPYLVQVGAFRNEANAREIVAKLRDKGYQPFIHTVQGRKNRVLHRVFLDHAKDKAQAQAAAKAFKKTEKMDALVMLADGLVMPNRKAGTR